MGCDSASARFSDAKRGASLSGPLRSRYVESSAQSLPQTGQSLAFDLTGPLSAQSQESPDLVEGHRLLPVQAETVPDDQLLPFRKSSHFRLHEFPQPIHNQPVLRALQLRIGYQVADQGAAVTPHVLFQRDHDRSCAKVLCYFSYVYAQMFGEFFRRWLPTKTLPQNFLRLMHIAPALPGIAGQPHRAPLSDDEFQHPLANPPGGVGQELYVVPGVEAMGGFDQSHIAFRDEILETYVPAVVFTGNLDDEKQMRLDEITNTITRGTTSIGCHRSPHSRLLNFSGFVKILPDQASRRLLLTGISDGFQHVPSPTGTEGGKNLGRHADRSARDRAPRWFDRISLFPVDRLPRMGVWWKG